MSRNRRKGNDDHFVAEGQMEGEYALGYIEHGMGRMVAGGREEHHVLGTQWFHKP